MWVTLPAVRGVWRTSWNFLRELVRVCDRVNASPVYLLAVMSSETNGSFDPAIRTPKGSATGLIQFTEETAHRLGTSTAALARMGQLSQLRYVEKFFAPHAKRNLAKLRPVDTYLAVFAPDHIGAPMSSAIYSAPSAAYRGNSGLDVNEDGSIQVSELDNVIQRVLKGAATRPALVVDVWPQGMGLAVVLGSLVVGGAVVAGLYKR